MYFQYWLAVYNGLFYYFLYSLLFILEVHVPPAEEQQEVPPGKAFY